MDYGKILLVRHLLNQSAKDSNQKGGKQKSVKISVFFPGSLFEINVKNSAPTQMLTNNSFCYAS